MKPRRKSISTIVEPKLKLSRRQKRNCPKKGIVINSSIKVIYVREA